MRSSAVSVGSRADRARVRIGDSWLPLTEITAGPAPLGGRALSRSGNGLDRKGHCSSQLGGQLGGHDGEVMGLEGTREKFESVTC